MQHNDKKLIEGKIQSLQTEKSQKLAQFEGKQFQESHKVLSEFETIQKLLDIRLEYLRTESDLADQQLSEYEDMEAGDREELKVLAKKYEKLMYFKMVLEKEIEAGKR